MSPRRVSARIDAPAASSTTAKARNAERIRHAGTARGSRASRPSRATKATSMGNCMKNVWMLLQGARMIAVSGSSALRPSSPLRRLAESKAHSIARREGSRALVAEHPRRLWVLQDWIEK